MRKAIGVILLCAILSCTPMLGLATGRNQDYLLFDAETNKILYMGPNDTAFEEKIEIDKNPDFMLRTSIPHKFIGVFLPRKVKQTIEQGKLIIFNIETARTEDVLDLGYSSVKWTYTENREHFFFSYRNSPTENMGGCDLLHYDVHNMKSEIITDAATAVNGLIMSYDEKQLIAMEKGDANRKFGGEVKIYSYQPLSLEKCIATVNNPILVLPLSSERLSIFDFEQDLYGRVKSKKGTVKVVDPKDGTIIASEDVDKKCILSLDWIKERNKVFLGIKAGVRSRSLMIESEGFSRFPIDESWLESHYYADKDRMYVLTINGLMVVDYKTKNIVKRDTGSNMYKSGGYTFYRIPNTDQAIIYCMAGGKVKYYDMEKDELTKKVSYGRPSAKFGNFMASMLVNAVLNYALMNGGYYSNTNGIYINLFRDGVAVATNPDLSRYYILNRATRDITVFDNSFERLEFIVPEESPQAMYLIEKPTLQTLVVSSKHIYKLNYNTNQLQIIHEFKEPSNVSHMFEEDGRIFVVSSRELLVLDPQTLAIKNRLMLFGDPDEKYTKLKKGEQRYYFIETL